MRPFDSLGRAAASTGRVAAVAALALLAGAADAVSLSPVLVEVTPARPVQTITMANPGDRPMRFQVQVLAWSQRNGVEVRTPSNDLIVAPAIADIPAGGRQIFRIASRTPPSGAQRAYRLVFEDIGDAPTPTGEVAVALRVNHDLPIFVSPPSLEPAALQVEACGTPAPGCVRVHNTGGRYGVVRALRAEGSEAQQTVNTRVLAGSWREWQLAVKPGAAPTRIRVVTDVGGPDVVAGSAGR